MSKFWNLIWKNVLVRTILLAVLVLILLVWLVLCWLNVYTQHGKAVTVPDVKGLKVEEAAKFLDKNTLRYEVIDSAFIKNAAPGSIVEMSPKAGTRVKESRIVYLTVNAFSTQMFTIPEVRDLSQRQATSMLSAIGFENVNVQSVPGQYRDLVVGLKYSGREVKTGEKLPANSRLTLEVSSGQVPALEEADTAVIEGTSEESWF